MEKQGGKRKYTRASPDGKICRGRLLGWHPCYGAVGKKASQAQQHLRWQLNEAFLYSAAILDNCLPWIVFCFCIICTFASLSLFCLLPFVSLPQTGPVTSNFTFPFHFSHSFLFLRSSPILSPTSVTCSFSPYLLLSFHSSQPTIVEGDDPLLPFPCKPGRGLASETLPCSWIEN